MRVRGLCAISLPPTARAADTEKAAANDAGAVTLKVVVSESPARVKADRETPPTVLRVKSVASPRMGPLASLTVITQLTISEGLTVVDDDITPLQLSTEAAVGMPYAT